MTDLLERVRALNPVDTCAEPSIDDVWRKLEFNEPSIKDEASVAASARVVPRLGARRPTRPNSTRTGRRSGFSWIGIAMAIAVPILVAAVALVTPGHRSGAGSAPAAAPHAPQLSPSQRLADGMISCYFATSGPLHPSAGSHPDEGPNPATGQSPIAYCRRWYGLNAHTGLNAAHVKFLACQSSLTNVAVYVANGQPNQCRRLGHGPLPPGYTAAQHQLASLGQRLVTLQHRHDCVTPAALAAEVRPALARLGFASWRITLPSAHPDSHMRRLPGPWEPAVRSSATRPPPPPSTSLPAGRSSSRPGRRPTSHASSTRPQDSSIGAATASASRRRRFARS